MNNWFNEPHRWEQDDDKLTVFADPQTDFWRKTHYGFVRDNGHFYYQKIAGNFEVETEFRGKYEALYDQAGIMVRLDETTWVKSGVEFVNGVHHVSAVVTRDFSDWSVVPLPGYPGFLRLRLKREGGTVIIEYGADDGPWVMFRTAYFSTATDLEVGRMVAAPDGPGFEATFTKFHLKSTNS
jgi:regulation of enolase protein 1 (concanavalin A-like superfamily)